MTGKHFTILLLALLFATSSFFYLSANADPVEPEHRTCQKDADCVVIDIGCGCCGSGDKNFRRDAVNMTFKKEYDALNYCSKEQRQRCMVSNCVDNMKAVAVCQSGRCKVSMVPYSY